MKKTINNILYTIIVFVSTILLASCGKDSNEPEPTPTPPTPVTPTVNKNYLQFNTSSANMINVTKTADNTYRIVTTGTDPYIYYNALEKTLPSDSLVFTFEYICTDGINDVQLFFGNEISENRSSHVGSIPAANTWTSWSVILKDEREKFSWGEKGQNLRIDFGTNSGVTIQIRNIYFRAMNEAEKKEQSDKEETAKKNEQFAANLKSYLENNYSSKITNVNAGISNISVSGNCSEEGTFALCEITPYEDVTETEHFANRTAISNAAFNISFERYVSRDGYNYDRTLSKWVIVKEESSTKDIIVSHARYADEITPSQTLEAKVPATKKGLGGFFYMSQILSDLDDLGITSVTVNVPVTEYIYSYAAGGSISHTYGGKTYYFSESKINSLDYALKECYKHGIVVSAILLIQPTCADPSLANVFKHPDFTEGYYTMPNMTTAESTNLYAATIDFIISRYSRPDGQYGRIHNWIMHNEVDAGLTWTNMGNKPMLVYLDSYIKSMRMCYNISRRYDSNVQVLSSFTHNWTEPNTDGEDYTTKKMLEKIIDFSNAEGDFQWGVALHPYPQDLTNPKTWNDAGANYSMDTKYVTFKNLEVINNWILQSKNKYKGTEKRTLWLSENGTNSPSYSNSDLANQAAGAAYAMKKIYALEGIDAIQWHNWIDNRSEFGLCIGLRRYPDDNFDPLGKKPVWYVYQAAGTDTEDTVFAPYLPVIGISSWDVIFHSVQ